MGIILRAILLETLNFRQPWKFKGSGYSVVRVETCIKMLPSTATWLLDSSLTQMATNFMAGTSLAISMKKLYRSNINELRFNRITTSLLTSSTITSRMQN